MSGAQTFQVRLETPEGQRIIDCGEEEFVWDAAARCGVLLPAICHQGRCLTCAARLTGGDVDQTRADAYFLQDRAAGFILLCRALPRSDLVITTHQESAMRRHRLAHGLPAPYA